MKGSCSELSHFKKYSLIFIIVLACIVLLYNILPNRNPSSVILSNLCGTWKTQFVMNTNEVFDNSESDITCTLFIDFYEGQEGLWVMSFSNNYPISSRSFSYSTEGNKLVLFFEDGKIEDYVFSINAGVLSLDGKLFAGDFVLVA